MRNTELKHAGNKTQDCDPLGTKQNVQDGMPSIAGRNVVRMLLEHVRCVFVSLQDSLSYANSNPIVRRRRFSCFPISIFMFFQILYAFSPYGLRLHFLATGRTTTGCLPFLVGRKPFPESAAQGRSEDVQLFWM